MAVDPAIIAVMYKLIYPYLFRMLLGYRLMSIKRRFKRQLVDEHFLGRFRLLICPSTRPDFYVRQTSVLYPLATDRF
jgi:hypothetical protein